jgi:hypothetical protein
MSRIRSIHPGLFSDEAFVSLTPQAQVFWIGLLCDADDQGVFEWKPISLKMRILPAAASDVLSLLEELETHRLIRRFESAGFQLGAIRNFCRYQRPKWPRAAYPIDNEIRAFTAADGRAESGAMCFSNDPTATTRQRRKRDRDRQQNGDEEGMSRTSRDDDGTVTARERRGEELSKNTTANAVGVAAPSLPSAEAAIPDWKTRLFREGIPIVAGLTGKPDSPTRTLIGKWLKSSRDDCRRVLRVLEDARDANPIDPVAWIEAALRGQQAVASHEPNSWRM